MKIGEFNNKIAGQKEILEKKLYILKELMPLKWFVYLIEIDFYIKIILV